MKYFLSLILILICSFNLIAQNDSVTVVFIGHGGDAKYKLLYNGNVLLNAKDQDEFRYEIPIAIDNSLPEGSQIYSLLLLRKGKFQFRYRDTDLYVKYQSGMRYLVVEENPRLKKRIAVDYKWSATRPKRRFEK